MKHLFAGISVLSMLLVFGACGSKSDSGASTTDQVEQNDQATDEKYTNEKYGFSITYPNGAFVLKQEDSNNEGAVFVSPDGQARLVIHLGNLDGKITGGITELQKAHADDTKQIGKRIVTLNTLKSSYYVLSGYENKTVFYQKTILSKGQIVTAVLYYDDSVKDTYYPMIEPIFKSFE